MKRVVLFLALLLFAACETPQPEITITLESDFSEVIAAIRQSNQSLADKLALIEASVRDGMADNEAAMKLIETAVSSLNGSMSEKLAAIEAALSAQTTSLETKLSLIEAAVAAGFADGQAQQDLLRTAIESLGGSMEDKLSAIEEAIGSQTTSLMAKLGLIEGAVQSGFADVTTAQELLQEAIDSLGETLGEKIAAIEKAVGSQTTSLAAKLALIEAAVEQGFAGQAASQELIRTALDSLTGSVEDKLAALEAAMESQTVSLETKLDAVAEAVEGSNVAGDETLELIRKAIESMNGNLSSKLSAIEKAVSDQTKSLETKLDLIEAAVSSGVTDIKQAQDLIRQAIDGAGTSLGEKIAAIEQAIGSQTTSLSAKLGLIETAVKNGLADEKKELDLISQALGTLDGDVKDKLDALERAMTSQTSGLETKLGAIAKAVEDGFVDEGKALDLVQQALGTLKDSVDGVDTDLKGKIDKVTEAVGKISTALTGDLSQKLTEIFNAIQGMKDYSAILEEILKALGKLDPQGSPKDLTVWCYPNATFDLDLSKSVLVSDIFCALDASQDSSYTAENIETVEFLPLNDSIAPIQVTFEKDKHFIRFHPDTSGSRVWRSFQDSSGVKNEGVSGHLIVTDRWKTKDTISNMVTPRGEKLFKISWFNASGFSWRKKVSISQINDNKVTIVLDEFSRVLGFDYDKLKGCRYMIEKEYAKLGSEKFVACDFKPEETALELTFTDDFKAGDRFGLVGTIMVFFQPSEMDLSFSAKQMQFRFDLTVEITGN